MDKVQFNIEVVNMRKVVKRVKVLIVHCLTRQVTRLRKKKGSEQQVLKNQRRATRFVAEIEAIKDLAADTVTKKAATYKKSLQEVLNNLKSSAHDRVLARVIHHRLVQERVIRFKGMVTKDLLRTGTKKYRRLRKCTFEAEADARIRDEEDYQVTLEKMITMDQDDDEDSVADDESCSADSNNGNESSDGETEDSQRYLSDSRHELHKELLEPSATCNEAILGTDDYVPNQTSDDILVPADTLTNKLPLRGSRDKKMDSMFLGSLSTMQDDVTDMLLTTRKEQLKQKAKRQQRQKQPHKDKAVQQITKESTTKEVPRVPMVDQPNPIRQTSGEKLIAGINCHPDLPPRHAPRDTHEKSSRKPFPSRPRSKQLPARQPANQSRQTPVHPIAATKLSAKLPAAKEILHPSWEASKKRKEASKIVPFQGKKITFDED